MNSDPLLVPTVAFWILAALTAVLPARRAVICYLLLVQLDLSALNGFSISSLGYENAIKVILIPTLLLFKIRKEIDFGALERKYLGFWALFAAYASLAILWSPYRLPAIKMIGYLYAYGALFVVFIVAWQHKWFSTRALVSVVWISLLGGVVQTYLLGNAYGSDAFDEWRFTTFAGAQSFAPFLLCLVVLLIFRERLSLPIAVTVLAASLGVLMTGSRSVFLGFFWVLMVYGIFSVVRSSNKVRFGMVFKRMFLIAGAVAAIFAVVIHYLPDNRLNEMVEAAVAKNSSVEDVGTFGWRLSLYLKTFDELTQRSPAKLLVGSGTSSGAGLVLDAGIFQEENVDANRALHDEFLRTLYEWGFVGLFAFLFFLAKILKISVAMVANNSSREAWAFLAIFVPFLISLTVENVLADSGSPGGVGYNLVLTSMMAAYGLFGGKAREEDSPAESGAFSGLPNPRIVHEN